MIRNGIKWSSGAFLFICPLAFYSFAAQPREKIVEQMKAAANYQISVIVPETEILKQDRPGYMWLGRNIGGWRSGTFHLGLFKLWELTRDPQYMEQMMSIGNLRGFKPHPRMTGEDDLCIGQMYLRLYEIHKDPNMLEPMKEAARLTAEKAAEQAKTRNPAILKHGGEDGGDVWSFADALFMAPPDWALLIKITGDADGQYATCLEELYKRNWDFLFDTTHRLYYRDTYFIGKTRNGRPIFWGRGNGWVMGSLALVLEKLPEEHPLWAVYAERLRLLSEGIAACELPAGGFGVSLMNHEEFPEAELSATALIAYGMTFGLNHGILPKDKYEPIVKRAWKRVSAMQTPDGAMRQCQQGGTCPERFDPKNNENYGTGAYLLFACEYLKMEGIALLSGDFATVGLSSGVFEVSERVVLGKAWPASGGNFALWTEGDRQYVVYYNSDGRTVAAQRLIFETKFTQIILPSKVGHAPRCGADESSTIASFDGHNYITIALDSEGYIHVSLNHHVNRLTYFRSTEPYDITTLVQVEAMVGDGSQDEDQLTYPKFMTTQTGEMLFHYRHGNSGAGYEVYNRYNVVNQKWTRFLDKPMISGAGLRNAYQVGPTIGPDGWYHMGWVWRNSGDAATSHSPSYARSRDLQNWETAAEEKLTLPITFGDEETRIDPIPIKAGIINGGLQLGFDSTNRMIATYHKFDESGNTQVFAARFTNGAWNIRQISDWNFRWDIGGHGTLKFGLRIGCARPYGKGQLAMNYDHQKYGSGVLVFDEKTFEPIRVDPPPPTYPTALDALESAFPGMEVHIVEDFRASSDPSARYLLRWEAFGPGNDMPRPITDDPSDLVLYKIVDMP